MTHRELNEPEFEFELLFEREVEVEERSLLLFLVENEVELERRGAELKAIKEVIFGNRGSDGPLSVSFQLSLPY